MSDERPKTKVILLNREADCALVADFTSDDGIFDGEAYDQYKALVEEGDRTAEDYTDFSEADCDF